LVLLFCHSSRGGHESNESKDAQGDDGNAVHAAKVVSFRRTTLAISSRFLDKPMAIMWSTILLFMA
jgi:hypothetical protein